MNAELVTAVNAPVKCDGLICSWDCCVKGDINRFDVVVMADVPGVVACGFTNELAGAELCA